MSSMSSMVMKYFRRADASKVEVVARLTIIAAWSYIFTIASLPKIIPPSERLMVGILGPTVGFAVPMLLLFGSAAIPSACSMILTSLLGATVVLLAATVSDGLFVTVYAILVLIATGLYFGPDYQKTMGNSAAIAALTGLAGLSLRGLVQDGFTLTLDEPPANATESSLSLLYDLATTALTAACLDNRLPSNCWIDSLPDSATFPVTIPPDASQVFGGRTAFITTTANNVTIFVQGGTWVVRGLWTWHGVDNSLAIFRNLLIAVLWALFIIFATIMIPPVRTARDLISKAIVPAALMQVSNAIHVRIEKDDGKPKLVDQRVHLWNVLSGGKLAMLAMFEPRFFRAPFEQLVPVLQGLLLQVDKLILTTFLLDAEKMDLKVEQEETQEILQACAAALSTKNGDSLSGLVEKNESYSESDVTDLASYVRLQAVRTLVSTQLWLEQLAHPEKTSFKEGMKNLAKTFVVWFIVAPNLMFKRFALMTLIPFRPKTWNLWSTLWAVERSAGFVILACMTVYWDAYANFAIQTGRDATGGVFNGWHLLGYAYAWRPTAEGTVKKGLQRLAATALGSFMAWLGIIVCSWSYDEDAEVNAYGLTVWLTVFSAAAGALWIEPGLSSWMVMGHDHGYFTMYFVMVFAIIALEVYLGNGPRDGLTANRIVATLTGVLMAMVVAIVPPNVYGGDPKHTLAYYEVVLNTWKTVLQTIVGDEDKRLLESEELATRLQEECTSQRLFVTMILKDASTLRMLPIFRVPETLSPFVEDVAITDAVVDNALRLAQLLAKNGDVLSESVTAELRSLLESLNSLDDATPDFAADAMEELPQVDTETQAEPITLVFLSLARTINSRFKKHHAAVNGIRFGNAQGSNYRSGGRGDRNGNGGRGNGGNSSGKQGNEDNHQVDEQNKEDAHLVDAFAGLAVEEVDGHHLDSIGSEASA